MQTASRPVVAGMALHASLPVPIATCNSVPVTSGAIHAARAPSEHKVKGLFKGSVRSLQLSHTRTSRNLTRRPGQIACTATAVVEQTEQKPEITTDVKPKRGGNKSGASSVDSGVRLEGIGKTFKNQQVLVDVSWEVKKGERVGLVGVNGAGKTTQLQIIAGLMEADKGEVIRANDRMQVAYLTQEFDVDGTRTVREELASVFSEALAVQKRTAEIEGELEGATSDMARMTALLDELDALQQKATAVDLYGIDRKIDKILPTLGFTPDDADRLVASFSMGWQMRISLGKVLLQEPELILLDEPTNHLDLDAITWLEGYLRGLDIPMVIVSHDREFLNQLCNKIVETEMGVSTTYLGNYDQFVATKKTQFEMQMAAWERQQKEIARQEEMVLRLAGGAQAGRAAAAEKSLEKLAEGDGMVKKPRVIKHRRFRFPDVVRSGHEVMVAKNVTHSYNDKMLFNEASLTVHRGERVAIVGPNGCGKSTLLRFIMGTEKPEMGEARLGSHQVLPNYFEQNQAEALDPEKSVLQVIEQAAEGWRFSEIKALLGRFQFKGEEVHKKVEWLSGGEKARLALAKFMVTKANLMVLDEPTNHLDIPTKEMLEEALRSYEGSVVAVSHDRYFLRQIVTRVVEIRDAKVVDYEGDYDYYLYKNETVAAKEAEREAAALEIEKENIKAKSKMSKAEKLAIKKQKAQSYQANNAKGKQNKNAKRWN